ncbi:MAG: hypothetical protein ACLGI9_00695, partial [Thermoanaerobaculia bacterium]
ESLVLSPDGGRMACLVEGRIIAQETRNGRLLLSTPVLPGEVWGPDRLRFLDARTLRFYGARLQGGRTDFRVVDFDLAGGQRAREIRVPGYDHALRAISPDGQRLLLRDRRLEPSRAEIAIADLRTGGPPVPLPVRGILSGLAFLTDGRVAAAWRNRGRIELRLFDGRGRELKRFDLPGEHVRLGGQPAPGLLALATTESRSIQEGWRSDLLDLETGAVRPIGEGLYPQGSPGLPPGSVGTLLFVQEQGGLVRIDPATGRHTAILRSESQAL